MARNHRTTPSYSPGMAIRPTLSEIHREVKDSCGCEIVPSMDWLEKPNERIGVSTE